MSWKNELRDTIMMFKKRWFQKKHADWSSRIKLDYTRRARVAPKGLLCGKRSKVWSWVQIGYVRPTSDGSDSLQNGQKYDIMRVLSVSTSTRFVTKWVNLDFCEVYMKDKILLKKTFKKSLVRISNHPWKNWRSQNRAFSSATSIWT